MTRADGDSPFLVATRRCRQVVFVVFDEYDILEVKRLKIRDSAPVARRASLRDALLQLATDYGARGIVVEDDTYIGRMLACAGLTVHITTVQSACLALLENAKATHTELFDEVLKRQPGLERFVSRNPETGSLETRDRRRTHVLLACALGLAAIGR